MQMGTPLFLLPLVADLPNTETSSEKSPISEQQVTAAVKMCHEKSICTSAGRRVPEMTGTSQQYTQAVTFSSSCIQNVLSNRDMELFEFARSSGVVMDPQVFKVLIDLLKSDVSPAAIFNIVQNMAQQASRMYSFSKKTAPSKSGAAQPPSKKKPPVAAKPKKIRVDHQDVAF